MLTCPQCGDAVLELYGRLDSCSPEICGDCFVEAVELLDYEFRSYGIVQPISGDVLVGCDSNYLVM